MCKPESSEKKCYSRNLLILAGHQQKHDNHDPRDIFKESGLVKFKNSIFIIVKKLDLQILISTIS